MLDWSTDGQRRRSQNRFCLRDKIRGLRRQLALNVPEYRGLRLAKPTLSEAPG